jgi:DNA-binding transcriptional MerR regulator
MVKEKLKGRMLGEKLYFKIGEVAEIVGVPTYVLRYWEAEFKPLSPEKNSSGQRIYSRRDMDMALKIKKLLYEEGYTIAGAKKRLIEGLAGEKKEGGLSPSPVAGDELIEVLRRVRKELSALLTMLEQDVIK